MYSIENGELIMVFEKYDDIFESYKNNRLAIFVGAGLSSEFRIPMWADLSKYLLNYAYENKILSKNVYDYCLSINDNKIIISMIKECFIEKNNVQEFNKIFQEQMSFEENNQYKLNNSNYGKLHKFLSNKKYGYHGFFLTTNADLILDTIYDNEGIINNPSELKSNFLSNMLFSFRDEKIIHLHGSIRDMNSIVFTEREYKERYQNSTHQQLLKSIFEHFTVLFIGYGLSDFELLYYLKEFDNKSKTHYVVKGYDSEDINEISKLEENSYFKYLNIKVIPYKINKQNSVPICVSIKKNEDLKHNINIIYTKNNDHSNLNNLINELCSFKDKLEEPFDDERNIIEILHTFKNDPYTEINNHKDIIQKLKEYVTNKSLFHFFIEQLINNGISKEWFKFLCEYNIITFKNDEIDIHGIIFLLYHISKNNYINTNCREVFSNIMDQLKCFNLNKLYYYDKYRIIGIFLNIDNKFFDNELKKISLSLFKNMEDYVPVDNLFEMISKLEDLMDYNFLFKYIQFVFDYKKVGFQIKTNLDIYEYKELIDNKILKLEGTIKIKVINLLISLIEELFDNGEFMSCDSIFDIETNIYSFYDCCLYALKSLIDDLEFRYKESYLIILNNKNEMLKRFYYYIIYTNYDSFKEYLWFNQDNPLNSRFAYEVSRIIDIFGPNLDENELNIMIKWISDIDDFYVDEKIVYSDKYGWLKKLDQKNEFVLNELNKIPDNTEQFNYSKVENYEVEDVPSSYYDILVDMSNLEIVEYVNSEYYNESEFKRSFEDLLSSDYYRFENIHDFVNLPERYQSILFDKLKNNNVIKNINNAKILEYILSLNCSNRRYYSVVLSYLELYLYYINSKNELFEKVLLYINEKIKTCSEDIIYLETPLKNSIGCCLYNLMYQYSFKIQCTDSNIFNFIEMQLKNITIPQFAYVTANLMSEYYDQFSNEIDNIISLLFSKELWTYSLRGVLESNYYKNDIYEKLNNKGIFNNILEPEFKNNHKKIVLRFSLSVFIYKNNYFYFEKIIKEVKDTTEVIKLIQLISKNRIKEKYHENFIKLWKLFLNTYDKHPDKKQIYKILNTFIKCVENVDKEVYDLLNKTIGYVSEKQAYTMMYEYKRLCKKSPKYVGCLLINQSDICDNFKSLKIIIENLENKEEYKIIKEIKEKYKNKYPNRTYGLFVNNLVDE